MVAIAIGCFLVPSLAIRAQVQIANPDEKHLYSEDTKDKKRARDTQKSAALKVKTPSSDDVEVKAPEVEFMKDTNQVVGKGGVIVSSRGIQAQADSAVVNLKTKDSTLTGDVVITGSGGAVASDSAEFNFESETGVFKNADVSMEEEGYQAFAREAKKLSEFEYELSDGDLTTCGCPDKSVPWKINATRTHVTQEGYAHCYGATMEFGGIPFMYTPYIAFPVKQERQSGLLAPSYGLSGEDGFQLRLPVFVVVDDSTDLTIAPFLETKTRSGTGLDFRETFSRNNKLSSRLIYSNERAREGDLRGTIVDGLADPEIDDDRFGGFLNHVWTSAPDASQSWALVSDVHYASDDLFIREIEDSEIGERNSRFLTSRMLFRTQLGDYVSAELGGEYNQSMLTNDDLVLQRLPELNLSALKSFRPFGFNPYGMKVTTNVGFQATKFARDTGYDGLRTDFRPQAAIPFHYKNYFSASVGAGAHYTTYALDETFDPGTNGNLEDSDSRTVPDFSGQIRTSVERVFELDKGNWLSSITSTGAKSQDYELVRLKHTIEPIVSYTYIPEVDGQDELPLFDSLDRIREKSLVSFGIKTSLYGKFNPTRQGTGEIEELTPRLENLPTMGLVKSLPDFGEAGELGPLGEFSPLRQGEVRELASLVLKQSYDYKKDGQAGSQEDGWSDLYNEIAIYPSPYFAMKFQSNLDVSESDFSSWGFATQFSDDRGDALRARYSYIEQNLSQLEGNLEIKLVEQLKFGYYTRYDEREAEFIENRVGLRFGSACNCWHADLGYSDRINPDKQQFMLSFTFAGLGDIAQAVSVGNKRQ